MIVTTATAHHVVAGAAVDGIGTIGADDHVIVRSAMDGAAGSLDDVVAA